MIPGTKRSDNSSTKETYKGSLGTIVAGQVNGKQRHALLADGKKNRGRREESCVAAKEWRGPSTKEKTSVKGQKPRQKGEKYSS